MPNDPHEEAAARQPAPRPLPDESYQSPRDAFEFQLAAGCALALGVLPVGIRDELAALGLDEAGAERAARIAGEALGRELSPRELLAAGTVERAAALLRARPLTGSWDCLVPIQPFGDGPRLICLHAAGGAVTSYTLLSRALGGGHRFYGLHARGNELSHPLHTSIPEMAACYVELLRARFEGPYALAGWSMGAAVAYEVARELRAQGEDVALVAALDLAPDDALIVPEPSTIAAPLLVHAFRLDAETRERLSALELEEFFAELERLAAERDKLPPGFGRERLRRMYDLNIVNLDALRAWRPEPYDGRVTVLKASDRAKHIVHDREDPTLGWGRVAREVRVVETPGTHFDFLGRQHLPHVARILREELDAALGARAAARSGATRGG